MRTKLVDTIAVGLMIWLIGYVASIILYGFVRDSLLGGILFLIFSPLGIYITYMRFRKRKETLLYYLMVALVWTVIAIVFDYIFIVKTFGAKNYYKLDVFVYYATTFVIPLLVGFKYRRRWFSGIWSELELEREPHNCFEDLNGSIICPYDILKIESRQHKEWLNLFISFFPDQLEK